MCDETLKVENTVNRGGHLLLATWGKSLWLMPMIKKILVVTFLSKDEEKGGNKETKAVMLSHTPTCFSSEKFFKTFVYLGPLK